MNSHYARRLLSPAAEHPPPPPPGHLDKTLSISFAAVFLASLAYVLLNSIIRTCRRRHAGHPTHPQPPDHPPPDPECLAQLSEMPVHLYHLPPPPPPLPAAAAAMPEEASAVEIVPEVESCSVCLGDYEEGEEVRALPRCGHLFHRACIDHWLLTRSSFCPVCRDRAIKREVEPMATSCRRNSNSNSNGGVLSPSQAMAVLSSVSNGRYSSML